MTLFFAQVHDIKDISGNEIAAVEVCSTGLEQEKILS